MTQQMSDPYTYVTAISMLTQDQLPDFVRARCKTKKALLREIRNLQRVMVAVESAVEARKENPEDHAKVIFILNQLFKVVLAERDRASAVEF